MRQSENSEPTNSICRFESCRSLERDHIMETREKLQLEANKHRAAARKHQVAAAKLDATLAEMDANKTPDPVLEVGDCVLVDDVYWKGIGVVSDTEPDEEGDIWISPKQRNGKSVGYNYYTKPASCTPLPRNLLQILKDLAAIDVPDGKVIVGVRPPKEGEQIILRSGEMIVNAVSGIESLHVIVEDE